MYIVSFTQLVILGEMGAGLLSSRQSFLAFMDGQATTQQPKYGVSTVVFYFFLLFCLCALCRLFKKNENGWRIIRHFEQ